MEDAVRRNSSIQQFRTSIPPSAGREDRFLFNVDLKQESDASNQILRKILESVDFKIVGALEKLDEVEAWRAESLSKMVLTDSERAQPSPLRTEGFDNHNRQVFYLKVMLVDKKRDTNILLKVFCTELGRLMEQCKDFFLVVDFTGGNTHMQRVHVHEALNIIQKYYPRFIMDELYIGEFYYSIPLNMAKGKYIVSLDQAPYQLFRIIPAHHVPVEYGGIPSIVPVEGQEKGSIVTVRARVIGWEVSFGARLVPTDPSVRPTIYPLLLREFNFMPSDGDDYEEMILDNVPFNGKICIEVENSSFKTKKLVYLCFARRQSS
ncbi:patellin-5-like [Chenopodium quinoa]|uniref:CRAL-TRIO domain-containing protein n=1 Tax=Chenopodium quinoa TaxID=63459 RepID=A0A803M4Z8_CHEQI|nr:patellin-5-like [Chenopodium quinoa]